MQMREIDNETEWEALADQVMAPLPQRWIYGAAAQQIGRGVLRLCVYEAGHPMALAQVVFRCLFGLHICLATHGPLFFAATREAEMLRLIRRALPFGVALISPERGLGGLPLSAAPEVAELSLAGDLAQLRARMDPKWRNGLRKAEKSAGSVTCIRPPPEALMPLLRAEKARQSKGAYRALPPEFTLALQAASAEALRLFTCEDAQMLFVTHGNTATYQIGHTGPKGRCSNAHNLILWEAMQHLRSEGITRLDLGTINRAKAPGLARFKLRTGAQARRLAPAHLL